MPCEPELAAYYRAKGYWTDLLLTDYLERAASRFPDKTAVKDERYGSLSYLELQRLALRLAAALQGRGISKGDRFVVALPNWHHAPAFVLALNYLGAVGVHLPITSGEREFQGVLEASGARGIVVPAVFAGRDFTAMIRDLPGTSAALEVFVSVGAVEHDANWQTFEQLLDSAVHAEPRRDESISAGDVTSILFTSGSSGAPKGVMHDSNTIGAMNTAVAPIYGFGPGEVILMAAPLGFSAGFVHGLRLALYLGATLVLQERWDAERYLELLLEEGATFSLTTPTLLRDFLELPRLGEVAGRLSLRVMLCGGNFFTPDLKNLAMDRLPSTLTSVIWGMTEGIGTGHRPETPPEQLRGTDGQAFLGTELKIVDDRLEDAEPGQTGELLMRGPSLFLGYFDRPSLTADSFLAGGWFRTGDLANIDEQGFVRITGRRKDIIIRGGANLSPAEIEQALATDSRIRDVACIGVPDRRLDERVCACVVPVPENSGLVLEDIVQIAREAGLARNKWPERLVLLDALPMTSSGKLRRPNLRAEVIERLGLEVS
jgi:acyl-CoA synthetase (AMP-forming)/AMP-acid ligase II